MGKPKKLVSKSPKSAEPVDLLTSLDDEEEVCYNVDCPKPVSSTRVNVENSPRIRCEWNQRSEG